MLFVVDVNVVFSALINKGDSFSVFESNKLFSRFEFVSPEFMMFELENRMDKLLKLTKLSEEELSKTLSFIKEQINFIPFSEFIDKLPEAIELNFKDSPYLALAMKLNCPIFSGDKELKEQTKIKVFSPRELLDMS